MVDYYTEPRDTDGHDFAGNDDIKGTRILTGDSVLHNLPAKSMSAWLKKIGSPTGTLTFGIWNSDGTLAKNWMELDMSTVTGTSTQYSTTTTTPYTLSTGQCVGVQYDGTTPDASNYIRIMSGYSNVTTPTGSFDNTYQAFSTWDNSDSAWEDTDTTLALAGNIEGTGSTPGTSTTLLPPPVAWI